jgi:DNA-binding CsgD family transcriptional regulator
MEDVLDEALERLPEPQRHAVTAALLREPLTGPSPDFRALAVGVLGMLRALSTDRPVLVAVDDVQWLDRATSSVLGFAMRRFEREAVRLLASRRSGESNRGGDFTPALEARRIDHLVLQPLTVGALHHIVREHLGVELSRTALVRIHSISGGNPFFGLEIARMVEREDRASWLAGAVPIPDVLADVVRDRLASLGERDREVLLAIAASARPTEEAVVRAFPPSMHAGLVLRRAVDSGLIEWDGRRVRFSHPLLASVLYSDASPEVRRRAHRRLGAAVIEPEERVRHLALAAVGPDPTLASSLVEASRRSLARGAPSAAAELLEMATRLTPHTQPEEALSRTVEQAMAHFQAGDVAHAGELLQQVAADLPPGPARARVLTRLGMVRADEAGWPDGAKLFERALADAGDDPALRRTIEQGLGYACLFGGDLAGSSAHAGEALLAAEASGEPAPLAESLGALSFVEFVLGKGVRSDHLDRGIALEEQLGSWPNALVLRPSFCAAQILKYTDRLSEARVRFLGLLELARGEGEENAVPSLLYHLAELECRAGDWHTAARHATESAEVAAQTGTRFYAGMADYAGSLVAALRGDVTAARAAGERGLAASERTGVRLATILNLGVLGFLELSLGSPAAALEHLGRASELATQIGIGEPGFFHLLPDQVEALVEVGRLDEAEAVLTPFEERGAALDRTWAIATGARCRGLLEGARGATEMALGSLSRSLEELDGSGYPFESARSLLAQGRVYRRGKQRRAARDSLGRALEVFDGLGATLWAAKTREELGRIGGRASGVAGLTPTEERVASLAADGMTNREIADNLFLTVRTVEWNLSKVYRKLQVRSRTELARAVREA